MRIRQHSIAIVVSAALAGTMNAAHADEAAALTHEVLVLDTAASNKGASTVTNKIAADFQPFAGSRQNATELVTGLREGSEITLTQRGHRTATFTPPTGHMGYGNVSTSLALAKYQLAQQGITNPTPLQLKAALNGGTIFVNGRHVTYDGVLQMRADGLGWGQIAHQLGTKLGPVVSGIKAQNTHIASAPPTVTPLPASGTTTGAATTVTQPRAGNAQGAAGKGIVNAGGSAATGAGKGKEDAGISTGAAPPSQPGRGMVTAGGQAVGPGSQGGGNGKAAHGPVTTAGSGAAATSSGAVTAAGSSAGNGNGGNSGNGKALGHSK